MKVVIIEDERPNALRLKQMLKEIDSRIEVLTILQSISESVNWMKSNPSPSLFFMDIRLSDGLCFEIFSLLEVRTPVIFTTAYDEYALKAFKVNSIDYLLKPIIQDELQSSLNKYGRLISNHDQQIIIKEMYETLKIERNFRQQFLVQRNGNYRTIPVKSICYIYSEYKNTFLALSDGSETALAMTLDDLENELDPRQFFRANRQHIIKLDSIASIHAYFGGKLKVVLNNVKKHEVIVSKEKTTIFKRWLDR